MAAKGGLAMIKKHVKTLRAGVATLLAAGVAICVVTVMPAAAQHAALPAAGILGSDSKIAFTGDRAGRENFDEISVMNADGTGERIVTPTKDASCNAINPRWSPNGHRIAFHCFTLVPLFSEIYLIEADGTRMTQLTNMTPAGLGAAFASWSPKGNKIAFNNPTPNPLMPNIIPNIYVVNVDDLAVTQLTFGGANRADWSPDGRKLVFNRGPQLTAQIYVADIDDPDGAVQLTFPGGANRNPRWSPDGSKITFESTRDGDAEIYVMNADGSAQLRLTQFPGLDAVPSFSPDGHWIVFHHQLRTDLGMPPNGSDFFAVRADGSGQIVRLTTRADDPDKPPSFSSFASWAPGALRPAEGAEH